MSLTTRVSVLFILLYGLSLAQHAASALELGPHSSKLAPYLAYSVYSDPAPFSHALSGLPKDLGALCALTKAQLIHPVADLPKFAASLPESRRSSEDQQYLSLADMLSELYQRDPKGLTMERAPEDRLIMSCRYHALLLAAMLKAQQIPVRLRYGFATYLYPGRYIYHVVCEVWDEVEQSWILVDPDRQKIDLSPQEFMLASEAWQLSLAGKVKPSHFGVPDWWGAHVILDVLCHDLAAVLGFEPAYWSHPPVYSDASKGIDHIPAEQMRVLTDLSELLGQGELERKQLQALYEQHRFLQFAEHTRQQD